jgi:glycine/D-amino acid oxidase-like deaminating enzyme
VTPDVAIVGAGVIGASCAFHFARAGFRVHVFDRGPAPGGGSTSRATGGFRAQFATAINIRLSLLAREQLRRFSDDTGVDPGFAPVGYLWLATSDAELAELRAANALQIREGLAEARIVARDDILAINPHVSRDGVIGAAWCPSDGTLRPMEILRGYLEAATRLGAEIHWNEPIVSFTRDRDRITHVRTPRGSHPTGLVVNAAGPWAASIAELAGVALPVEPLRRQVALTEPMTLPASMPLTIWLADGFHIRVRDDRALLLMPTPGDPGDAFNDRVDSAWLDAIAAIAPARIPALRDVALDRPRAWAGLYELSPDHHAILGFAGNLLLVNGSSGHGVMHAPALGLLASELAAGTTPSLDVHALRPSRFADGDRLGPSLL